VSRRVWNGARWIVALALVVFWFLALRPQGLGGPAEFVMVSGHSMEPTMHTGDLVVVHRHADYGIGDVVAYRVPKGDPAAGAQVIHRIVGGDGDRGFVVQGDNRTAPDIWRPRTRDVIGSEWAYAPKVGRVILFLHGPIFIAALATTIVVCWILFSGGGKSDDCEPHHHWVADWEHSTEGPDGWVTPHRCRDCGREVAARDFLDADERAKRG
jgi:signal peptidase I